MKASQVAAHLLGIEKRRSADPKTTWLYTFAAAILNLFFCAYVERSLTDDISGFAMILFLAVETAAVITLSAISFFTTLREILMKTRIFPITPTARLLFVLASDLRRPLALALIGSTAFSLFIALQQDLVQAVAAALLFLLLVVTAETLYATAILVIMRHSIAVESVIAVAAALLVVILMASVVFHVESLFTANLLLHWALDGIVAAGRGNAPALLWNVLCLMLTGVGTIALGRRYA